MITAKHASRSASNTAVRIRRRESSSVRLDQRFEQVVQIHPWDESEAPGLGPGGELEVSELWEEMDITARGRPSPTPLPPSGAAYAASYLPMSECTAADTSSLASARTRNPAARADLVAWTHADMNRPWFL